jgi:hypothetical protein
VAQRSSEAALSAALDAFVSDGIQRATAYGIEDNSDITVYLDLMIVFGREFDQLPWACAILEDSDISSSADRVAWLYDAAVAQLDADHAAHGASQ